MEDNTEITKLISIDNDNNEIITEKSNNNIMINS